MSALRRFLVDFDALPPPSATPPSVQPAFDAEPSLGAFEAGSDALSLDFAADSAVDSTVGSQAEAVTAALAEAEATHAAALAALSDSHAAELAEARASWSAGEGAALAEALRSAVADLGETIGEAAASALEPLLGDAARAQAVDGLRTAIADLVLAGTGGSIAVTGPDDLLASLRAALDEAGIGTDGMSFNEGETAEVVVTADNSRIETRLDAWAAALGRRLGSAAGRSESATGEDAP